MEDQPADSGDLTTDAEEAAEEPRRTPVGKAGRASKPVVEQEPEEATDADVILVPHKPAGKRLKIAAVAAGVLFVVATAFAGAMVQPYLADRALVHTKLDVARTARDAITTLWTYTPDNMDSLPDRAERYLGGDFANEYRKYIDAIVAPNKQAQVTNTTEVLGAAVESIGPTEATALVYTNSVATSPVTKNIPSLRYLSYRLTMERRDAKWLITRMSTVTSFDLTPQL
ncbi:mammalian cell entry protein [Mycobacterium sp.]|uniref:mammalian cell entry protein n=1 Tax=Mycobacterium sp. TaxID=1785 RepID=UPI002D19840E|nr:mammalian cell entry protein [Mycobacterium sp.]HKP42291.1 mammalian cell entry protein [Mycobacterium sp.]